MGKKKDQEAKANDFSEEMKARNFSEQTIKKLLSNGFESIELLKLMCENRGVIEDSGLTLAQKLLLSKYLDEWAQGDNRKAGDKTPLKAQCVDTDAKCGANPGWPASMCSSQSFIRVKCPAMCGICAAADPNDPCGAAAPPASSPQRLLAMTAGFLLLHYVAPLYINS